MADLARIGLTVAGGIWGGPIGALAGSLAGDLLFGTGQADVEGPRADTGVTTSAYGTPLPIVLGTDRVSGQLWDADEITEVSETEGGGKGGGGPEVTTYSYFATFMMAIAEVPSKGDTYTVRRVWRNKKLVYDRRVALTEETPDSTNTSFGTDDRLLETFESAFADQQDIFSRQARSDSFSQYVTFYDGSDTQDPDPVLEALHGVGNVPAYRGICYMVAQDMPLADTGNQIGTYEFEISNGTDTPTITKIEGQRLFPWGDGALPLNDLNHHIVTEDQRYTAAGTGIANGTYTDPLTDDDIDGIALGWKFRAQDQLEVMKTSAPGPYTSDNAGGTTYVSGGTLTLDVQFHKLSPAGADVDLRGSTAQADDVAADYPTYTLIFAEVLTPTGTSTQYRPGFGIVVIDSNDDPAENPINVPDGFFFNKNMGSAYNDEFVPDGYSGRYYISPCTSVTIERDPYYRDRTSDGLTELPDAEGWYIDNDTGEIVKDAAFSLSNIGNGYRGLQAYADDPTGASGSVDAYPLDPVLDKDDADNTQTFWEAAAGDAGQYFLGTTYGSDYPDTLDFGNIATFSLDGVLAAPISLADAVTTICELSGIDSGDIDTSELSGNVWGMSLIGGTGRDYINHLRSYGFFDAIESEGKIHFRTRGGSSDLTITADDLGGDTRLETERQQDIELPKHVRVQYKSLNAAYQSGQQDSERLSTDTDQVMDIKLPIATTDEYAARVAEVISRDLWRARNTRKLVLPRRYDQLDPADIVSLTLDSVSYRLRIAEKTYQTSVELRCVDDQAALYTSEAVGEGTEYTEPALGLRGPTNLLLMDLPALKDGHDSAGYYVAVWGTLSAWPGATVQIGRDGTHYEDIISITSDATVVCLRTLPGEGPHLVPHRSGSFTVELLNGSLSSTTETAWLNGTANSIAIGADDRWEILTFRYATENSDGSWTLSELIRGRKGTEWAIDQAVEGDYGVVLTTAVQRIPGNLSDLNDSKTYRAATLGTSYEAAATKSFTPEGVSLEPWAPANIKGVRNSDGDITISWIRRTRIGGAWQQRPLYEDEIKFDLLILDSNGEAVRTETLTFNVAVPTEYEYSAADQTTDFGSTQSSVDVKIYQVSGQVGRGYPAEATV